MGMDEEASPGEPRGVANALTDARPPPNSSRYVAISSSDMCSKRISTTAISSLLRLLNGERRDDDLEVLGLTKFEEPLTWPK